MICILCMRLRQNVVVWKISYLCGNATVCCSSMLQTQFIWISLKNAKRKNPTKTKLIVAVKTKDDKWYFCCQPSKTEIIFVLNAAEMQNRLSYVFFKSQFVSLFIIKFLWCDLLSFQDDRPVKDDLNVVSVKWGFGPDTTKYNNTEYSIPEDGIIKLKVRLGNNKSLINCLIAFNHFKQQPNPTGIGTLVNYERPP